MSSSSRSGTWIAEPAAASAMSRPQDLSAPAFLTTWLKNCQITGRAMCADDYWF